MYKGLTGALVVLTAASAVHGKQNEISSTRKLTPEEIGAYHTEAFDLLGEKYSKEKPKHVSHFARDLVEILSGYCSEDDSECKLRAYQATREEFHSAIRGTQPEIIYPEDFDDKLKNSINMIFEKVENINELNLDEVLQSLEEIKEEIEGMNVTDENHRYAGLVGVSVAMESSKLWHSTHYDEAHPLHDMIHAFDPQTGHRRLQFQLPFTLKFDTAAVTIADVRAAIFNVVNTGGDGEGISGITDVFFKASAASASAFAGTVSIAEREDDDDYYYVPPTEPKTDDTSGSNNPTQEADDVFGTDDFDDFFCNLVGGCPGS